MHSSILIDFILQSYLLTHQTKTTMNYLSTLTVLRESNCGQMGMIKVSEADASTIKVQISVNRLFYMSSENPFSTSHGGSLQGFV